MKPQKDYSFIRGVCHNPGNGPEEYRKEIGYAVRMGINSFRAWLPERKWKEDPAEFFAYTDMLLDLAWESGISVMPILFNGNMLDPAILEPEWMETKGDEYVRAVVERYRSHPGLIMWDVMNEPSCNDWLRKCTPEERPARWEKDAPVLKALLRAGERT